MECLHGLMEKEMTMQKEFDQAKRKALKSSYRLRYESF